MDRVDLRKLRVVFRREYLERVRSKWFVIGTLLGPVFFGLFTLAPLLLSPKKSAATDLANVVILDATGTGLGARVRAALVRSFPLSPAPRLKVLEPAQVAAATDSATLAVSRKEENGYLLLDSNTVANRSVVYAGRNVSSRVDVQLMMASVKQQILAQRLEHEGLDPVRVTALTAERLETRTVKIGDDGQEKGSVVGNFLFGYMISFLLYLMIVLYGQNILRGVMEEKTTRVAEVVVSSVTPDTLLAGKVLGVGLVAITQVLSWVALSAALLYFLAPMLQSKLGPEALGAAGGATGGLLTMITGSLPTPGTALVILIYFVLGFIFYASLFAAVGAMVSSQEDIQQAAMPVMVLLVSSVLFMQPILLNPGSTMSRTMSLIPFSAPILMPLRMTLVPVPWWELAGSLIGVGLGCLAAIWLSARIYRVGLLMYGKRPSFRELARWIRYAG